MATVKVKQTNFTGGEVQDLLIEREDFQAVGGHNAAALLRNVLLMPQGGITRRPGMQLVRELAKQMSETDLSGATVTAPEGGTASNLTDDDPDTAATTSGNLSTTNPFVVAHVDFGAAQAVDAVDVINYKLSSGTLDDEFVVQYSDDDASWTTYGTAFNWSDSNRSRRRRTGVTETHRYWRVARVGSTSVAATASIGELKFWEEGASLSAARLIPFSYSTEESYMMLATDQNMDVIKGDFLSGSVSIPHISSQMAILNKTQSLDTLLLYHPKVRTQKVFRQGGDDEFDFRDLNRGNIPRYDYGAGTGGVNEVQRLNDGGTLASGNKFTILLDGERTDPITAGAARATTAASIQTALRALDNTSSSGITVTDNADYFEVTFAGDDGAQPWGEMSVSVLTGNSVWNTRRETKGLYPGEDVMSDTRGWPRTGVFYQQRLHEGGVDSLPDAWLASIVGFTEGDGDFDFDTERDDDTKALFFTADTDQVSAIYNLVAGRHLSIFTSDGEFYIPTEPIDASAVMKQTTRSGSKEGLPIFEADGALLFFQGVSDENETLEKATALREFLFIDTEQSYQAGNLSRLAPHLINNPVSVHLRKAIRTEESDLLILVNEDGKGAGYTTMRLEQVGAFTRVETGNDNRLSDKLLAVGVDKKRRVYFVTERVVNGTAKRFLERWNDDLLLDCGGIVDVTGESYTASAGQTVFNYTFTSPALAAAVGVQINGGRLESDQYTVDLGTKTVTLDAGAAEGDTVRLSSMIDEVSGLDLLEGESVQVMIDGTPESGTFAVSSGIISLGKYADSEVQYGFDFNVYGKLLPFNIPGEQGQLDGEKMRVVRALFSLYQTGDIEVRLNNGAWRSLPLVKRDEAVLDRSMMDLLASGEYEARGGLGWTLEGNVEFRQSTFAPLTIRSITREVAV